MSQDYTAIIEVEYLLGHCQDEEDAAEKAVALLDELRNTDTDINTATLIEVQEW